MVNKTIRLEKEIVQALEKCASKDARTFSALVRKIIKEWLYANKH